MMDFIELEGKESDRICSRPRCDMQGTTAPTQIISLSSLVSAFIGLLLGLASAWLLKKKELWDEKQRLINLFLAEIGRTSLEIDSKKNVPTGVVLARAKGELFGIGDVTFTGKPEYELAVYHVKLYETEGIRLAQLLGSSGRKHFWAATGYLRDAEAVRLVIKQLKKEDRDYDAYEKIFVALIGKGSDALAALYRDLWEERSSVRTFLDSISPSNP
jgi:hypothetical protein